MEKSRHVGRAGHSGKRIVVLVAVILAIATLATALPALSAVAAPRRAAVASVNALSVKQLSDTSIDGPDVWTSNPGSPNIGLASVMAWTGTNSTHSLNIMQSSDGVTYGGKVTFPESAIGRPAVAVQGPPTTIILAWTGVDSKHSLNLLCQGPACGSNAGSYKKLTLSFYSGFNPALTRFGNGYLLAWVGADTSHELNVLPFTLTTSGAGFNVGARTTLNQFSAVAAPDLSVNPHNNQLLMSWTATTPFDQFTFATSNDGVNWSGAQTPGALSATSAARPAGFAVADSRTPTYWIAWTGRDRSTSVNVAFTSNLAQWPSGNQTVLGYSAFGGPALGYTGYSGVTLLAWTSANSTHNLEIATINPAGTPTLDQRIDSYLAGLSTTQLIGQTIMMSVFCTPDYNSDSGNLTQALQQWDVGSAIMYNDCNGVTEPGSATGLQQLDQALQSHANIPGTLLIGLDEEGGTVDRLAPYYGSTPSARQLASTGNPLNAYNQAQTDAGRMRNLGVTTDFAPVVDVDQGGGAGTSRMFGTTVGVVTTYGGAFLNGLQQYGVSGTLKHFPGIGASTGNPDYVLPTINSSQSVIQSTDFPPFENLLYEAPGMIMATTVMVPAYDTNNPAMLSPTLLTTVLRGQIGYQGVIITDSLGGQGLITYMQQQGYPNPTQGIAEAAVRAFLAGADLLLCPQSQTYLQAIVAAMATAVSSGRISRAKLLASDHRILKLKIELGQMTIP